MALSPGEALAAAITKAVTVQVYQVCDDAGNNCASTGPAGNAYFSAETNKIWSQAGIAIAFDFVAQINSTAFSYLDDHVAGDRFADLAAAYGTMGPSTTTIDMFLVREVAGSFYGQGWFGMGGFVMSMDTLMNFNGGLGRVDTIAHELGHNFGLVPIGLGGDAGGHSSLDNYLMARGEIRLVPMTLADIAPDGLGLDMIPQIQADFALQSSLLSDVPEPMSLALVGTGLLGLVMVRRRGGRGEGNRWCQSVRRDKQANGRAYRPSSCGS